MDATAAMGRLAFRRHLRAMVGRDEGAYLFSEHGMIALRGARIGSLAALLDGERDLADLIRVRPGGMDADQITRLVDELVAARLVTLRHDEDGPGTGGRLDDRALAYWDACGVDPAAVPAPGTTAVSLVAIGNGVDPDAAACGLRAAGCVVDATPPDRRVTDRSALTVVLCDDYLHPRLAEIDAAHRAEGRTWLLAKPVGARVWLGPFFSPDPAGGCWHCLANRLWAHRRAEACVLEALGEPAPAGRPASTVPALTAVASNLVALEVVKWLAGYRYAGQRSVWILDSLDLCGQRHELRPRPQCPACGDPILVAERMRRPVVLRPALKAASGGGGHRTLTPLETLDRYRHLISPVTGIVKEVKRDPAAPAFINAYRSGANISRGAATPGTIGKSLRLGNGGKGLTPIEAEVGALCEAVERFSAGFQGDEAQVRGSLRGLRTRHRLGGPDGEPLHPNDCLLYDERQYAGRAAWNREHSPFNVVCAPFDENAEMDWTPLWSLTGRRQRLLPTSMLFFGAPASPYVRADSNGNAAGSSLEDAILQGALELVERDAVAIWWYNRLRAAAVDLAAFGEPWIDDLRRRYAGVGREFWVLDLTSDLGVPVMAAVTRRLGVPGERLMLGFGAHLDPRVALRRALTELNQLLPAILDDRSMPVGDPDAIRWLRDATVANQPYLLPAGGARPRTPADFGYRPSLDVRDDVERLTRTIATAGMDMLVLDQTRPDVGLPVVKVVVPGLRPFWARFAPGRLFDVPVLTGQRARPIEYADLNPVPLFL